MARLRYSPVSGTLTHDDRRWGGGGGRSGGGTTVQSQEPWAGLQPYLSDLYSRGSALSYEPREYYPFGTTVPFSPDTLESMDLTRRAATVGAPGSEAAMDFTRGALAGDIGPDISVADQYLRGFASGEAVAPQLRDTEARLQDIVMGGDDAMLMRRMRPGIEGAFSGGGRFGSPAMAEALGRGYAEAALPHQLGAAGLLSDIGSMRSGIQLEAARAHPYISALPGEFQRSVAGMAPAIDFARRQPFYESAGALRGIGALGEAKEGELLGEQMSRFDFPQEEERRRLAEFGALIGGTPTFFSTSTTGPGRAGGFSGMGALGGASTMGGLLGGLGPAGMGAFGAISPWAAIPAMGAAGLMGGLK